MAELLIAAVILGLLLALAFGSVTMVTKLFNETELRQSAELQLRSIKLLLERDLELTDFWMTNSLSRGPTGDMGSRDALAVTTLSDWQAPSRYDGVTGRPLWDRYVVWYATQEEPGRLIRQVVAPGGGGLTLTEAYQDLSSNLSEISPEGNRDVLVTRYLSEGLESFRVTPRLQNGTVQVQIQLRSEGGRRAQSMERATENLELTLTFRLRNTWPKI